MDWKWTFLYGALAVLALRFAWHFPCRRIALAIVANVILSNLLALVVPPELTGAVNTVVELLIVGACISALQHCRATATVILLLSLLSTLGSFAYAMRAQLNVLTAYEAITNVILVMQCFVLMNMGLWNVVGDRAGRFLRWRAHRRHARNARYRMGLAAGRQR